MTPEQIKLRKRFYDDFDFYGRHALKVRAKNNEIVPFKMNAVQRRFYKEVEDQRKRTGKVRKIILKGRQQGFSTWVGARKYFRLSQRRAKRGLVVAHKADSTRALFDMYRRYHNNCPVMLRPDTSASSRRELLFSQLDTGIVVATAGGDGIGRGEMFSDMHLSEIGFWNPGSAEENFNGLMQCLPNTPDTECYIESTANGFNLFKTLWDGAVAGENEFEPFFAAWFETPEYRETPPEGFERTVEEQELADTHGLDDEQLWWRRLKINAHGREKFMQEYPCTPEEAFIASGRPVFDPEDVSARIEVVKTKQPLYRMDIEETAAGHIFSKQQTGRLKVYRERADAGTYVIGADVGMGVRDGDWSVAHVLDDEKRQVAVWRGQVHPDYFATILDALGRYYNSALVGPERNNHGILTCVRLWKDLSYPNVFLDVTEGQTEDRDSVNIGFLTSAKSRPLIIDRLRAAVREGDIEINDLVTLQEMQTFVVNEAGRMEAEANCHDDAVMSLCIANHIHPGRYVPIQVSDDDYCEAI